MIPTNLLRSMSPLGKGDVSARDKKYLSNVQKTIASFASVVEWADYISFLGRLQKALQSNPSKDTHWIPEAYQVSKLLSQCLSNTLPNGVHKKCLELYHDIFIMLGQEKLGQDISIWLPGLLPLMNYASITVRPQLIDLFSSFVAKIAPAYLHPVLRALLLGIWPALDDPTSECFESAFQLVDNLKKAVDDNEHFWKCLFLSIINSGDRKLGALLYCDRHMPSFNIFLEKELAESQNENILALLSSEARECVNPEPGLLITAMCKGLQDESIFVQRGFFDLLTSRLELRSDVIQKLASQSDKEKLLLTATSTVLKKDMSLNRRLWFWLLGPETSESSPTSRSEYFKNYGLEILTSSLLKLLDGNFTGESIHAQKLQSFKISLAVLDKWEIAQFVIPRIFLPSLEACKETATPEILMGFGSLFDSVEAVDIWSDFIKLIETKNYELMKFMLKNFNIDDEDMIVRHVPLVLITILISAGSAVDSEYGSWIEIARIISNIIPARAYLPLEHADAEDQSVENIKENIDKFYSEKTDSLPYNPATVADITYNLLKTLVSKQLNSSAGHLAFTSDLLADFVERLPTTEESPKLVNDQLIQQIVDLPFNNDLNIDLSFGLIKLVPYLSSIATHFQLLQLLKKIIGSLWPIICDPRGIFQVEVVNSITKLEIFVDPHCIEGELAYLFLSSEFPFPDKLRAFATLWTHTNTISGSSTDSILSRSLELVVDNLAEKRSPRYVMVSKWIDNLLRSSSINRLYKNLVNPILTSNRFLSTGEITDEDDLALFAYQIETIINLLTLESSSIQDSFANELCVLDSDEEIHIVNTNNWNVDTYKMLLVNILKQFISIPKVASDIQDYERCTISVVSLLELLIDGEEKVFSEIVEYLLEAIPSSPVIYLECLTKLLSLAHSKHIGISIFEVRDDSCLFIDFLKQRIATSRDIVEIECLMQLVSQCSLFLNDSIFSIVVPLTSTICRRLSDDFESYKSYVTGDIYSVDSKQLTPDLEQIIPLLMNGLEDLLTSTHGYWKATEASESVDLSKNANDQGFFGSMINGVFQAGGNKDLSALVSAKRLMLQSFQLVIDISYKIWLWSDLNSSVSISDNSNEASSITDLGLTISYAASTLKYRPKKLLGTLYGLESIETLESLVSFRITNSSIFKLIHILDGAKHDLALQFLLNSLTSRVFPNSLDEDQVSTLNIELTEHEIVTFILGYCQSLDNDSIEDIWLTFTQFLKDVESNNVLYRQTLPGLIKITHSIGVKNTHTRFGEQKKIKRELSDHFVKLLNFSINARLDHFEDIGDDSGKVLRSSELCEAMKDVSPKLTQLITDRDKLSGIVSSLISNVLQPIVKSKSIPNIPDLVLELILAWTENGCLEFKSWKGFLGDVLNDTDFFKVQPSQREYWDRIFVKYIGAESEKMAELVTKFQSLNNSNNLFNWNDAEIRGRSLLVKRICYLILIGPQDTFMDSLKEIMFRLNEIIKDSTMKPLLFLTLRILVLKFSPIHLSPYWTLIVSQMEELLLDVLEKSTLLDGAVEKDHNHGNGKHKLRKEAARPELEIDLDSLLSGCKLLDVLIMMKPEEFQLSEWLFIQDSALSQSDDKTDTAIPALIERLSHIKDLNRYSVLKSLNYELTEKTRRKPLLEGINTIDNIGELKEFFDSLSFHDFECNYNINAPDYDAPIADSFADVFEASTFE
ncbi:Endosome to Golgi transport protein [Komagataella phaffii CBS 7435]|uniref:Endosome to Golgi transport protein n=1 Tax=Komagataella phaffii (strain ATCC 76273 / CBS 7435 / CECT 11047 / NRRL Y-11430 / Wegner 21-1) TaxID=981350 RepID=F2QTS4_KOMPC|nr:GQ67_00209T0 [Komagataella phaffii]CAH2448711.1 Endosome to Golgi transport protein [Komagataella phaffii CBS 7435]CCA38802.1 Endosome to Golgi transport protein [Komagataella phaffii CBS 7435]